jgi:hypothetical protein
MAVRAVSIFQPRDGRRDDFLKEAGQAKEILTRLGARFRLGEMVVGGPNTGQMVVTLEFDDLAGYAKFMQTSTADREWQEFQSKSNRENGSRTLVSRALVQDLL